MVNGEEISAPTLTLDGQKKGSEPPCWFTSAWGTRFESRCR